MEIKYLIKNVSNQDGYYFIGTDQFCLKSKKWIIVTVKPICLTKELNMIEVK